MTTVDAQAARVPAQPGKQPWQQWPADLTVEYGPAREGGTTAGFTAKTYAVYLDGQPIGDIKAARERTYRQVKGMTLRQPTGYATRWQIRAVRGPVARPGIEVRYTGRAEATARLLAFHRTGSLNGIL